MLLQLLYPRNTFIQLIDNRQDIMDQPTLDKCPGHNLYIGGYVRHRIPLHESSRLPQLQPVQGCNLPAT